MRIAILVCAIALLGGAENARIDVDGIKAAIRLEQFSLLDGVRGEQGNGHWIKEEKLRPRFLYNGFTVPPRTWTQVGFRFTPSGSGPVVLILRGPFKLKPGEDPDSPTRQLEPVPTVWDDVEVEGAKLLNGGFETPSTPAPGGAPAAQELLAWTRVGSDDIVQVLTGEGVAHGGGKAVRCWHNAYFQQLIKVRKDEPVTIRAWAWAD